MERLKKRAEFLAVAGGARASRRSFVLQKGISAPDLPSSDLPASDAKPRAPRFGFTATKKTGNSPERNRMRRRLREAARLAGVAHAMPSTDYVLVARRAALSQPFDLLISDLISSLDAVAHAPASPTRAPRGGKSRRPNGPSDLSRKIEHDR